jgi:hypothetical protein
LIDVVGASLGKQELPRNDVLRFPPLLGAFTP